MEKIIGLNWHAASCVDGEGKVECCCGLEDLEDERHARERTEPEGVVV